MRNHNFWLIIGILFSLPNKISAQNYSCDCDTTKAKSILGNHNYSSTNKYDAIAFQPDSFYTLDKTENRRLWYREIEYFDTTKFTKLWNDYAPSNYHASHADFIKFYENKDDIELAFQFGPNSDLWAYHTFVVRKIECCYLIVRTYFRHARFTSKSYSLINKFQLDSLFSIIESTRQLSVTEKVERGYKGYFIDNRNKKTFFIDFEKESVETGTDEFTYKPEILELFRFVHKKINWIKSYSL